MEAVRYTLAAAPAFGTAARILESWLKEEEPSDSLYAEFDKQKKNCGKCGDPLPDDTNVCPKCVDRKGRLDAAAVLRTALQGPCVPRHFPHAGRHGGQPAAADP